MSGIEVVGLVLGAFPILLNCLDYYHKGFEPLEQWWNFRTHFIAFVDEVRHQMMKYRENIIRLLDPIIADSERLAKLVDNPDDPFWKDDAVETLLRSRLSSEMDRFLRILDRMHMLMIDLKRLLQIEDGHVRWVGSSEQKPLQWHFQRMRISFSKGKHKKIKKLASHNQELEDILGYSERIVPISNRRKASGPVAQLEKIRRHVCSIHGTLKQRWECPSQCHEHEARLQVNARVDTIAINVTFVADDQSGKNSRRSQEISIQVQEGPPVLSPDISFVQQSAALVELQHSVAENNAATSRKAGLAERLIKKVQSKSLSPFPKSVKFQVPSLNLTSSGGNRQAISGLDMAQPGLEETPSFPTSIPVSIEQICSFLYNSKSHEGLIRDEFDRQLCFSKKHSKYQDRSTTALLSLSDLLKAYHSASLGVPRQSRFEIAAHVASALLQTHLSPWLASKWSKNDFYFLTDTRSQTLCSNYPLVLQSFSHTLPRNEKDLARPTTSSNPNRSFNEAKYDSSDAETPPGTQQPSEEDVRDTLFSVGVIVLELIFGLNIEDCPFRKDYYGLDNKPNDQTDISTARKWAKKVLGECGANIDDVVRRCLDCSFGPRPKWTDVRFRESVYEGVISPLVNYANVWPEAMT